MPGVYGWRTSGRMNLDIRPYLVEGSQTIYAGDLVVLVDNVIAQRVKKLTQVEIDADYTETSIKGILGWAMHEIVTDADGVVTQLTPSTVEAGARATYALPSYASGIDRDTTTTGGTTPDKGNARLNVAIFDSSTEVLMQFALGSDAVATVDAAYLGTTAGVQITDTINFKLDGGDTSGDDSCFIVTGLEETEPTYNTSSKVTKVYAMLKPTLQQLRTGLLWTT